MRIHLLSTLVLAAAVAASGCATAHHTRSPQSGPQKTVVVTKKHGSKHGPPPHAPAHGYRYKHRQDRVELIYDDRLEAYRVAGHDHCYYDDGVYFRFSERGWEMAATWSGEWGRISIERVPLRIRSRER